MKKWSKVLIIAMVCSVIFGCAQNYEGDDNWFYTGDNRIGNLVSAPKNETIPLLKDGTALRILKISNFKGTYIKNIEILGRNQMQIDLLPMINDLDGKKILDVIMPLKPYSRIEDKAVDRYFFVKIIGNQVGADSQKIIITTDQAKYIFAKKTLTSKNPYIPELSLNVFAYFDYNFLLKGMKQTVINDLTKHHANVLVIPPSAIPSFGDPSASLIALEQYLSGTENKFKYYILYLNLNRPEINTLVNTERLRTWFNNIQNLCNKKGILQGHLLLFPYDEPKGNDVNKLLNIKRQFRSAGISNPFYVTIDKSESYNLLKNQIEYLQVQPEVMQKNPIEEKDRARIWLYGITYSSINRRPAEYRKMAQQAYFYNTGGIGLWSYSDVSIAADQNTQQSFIKGKGSWEIKYKEPTAEYSLIYRRGNEMFSSLRWENLVNGMEDVSWLKFNDTAEDKLQIRQQGLSEYDLQVLNLKLIK